MLGKMERKVVSKSADISLPFILLKRMTSFSNCQKKLLHGLEEMTLQKMEVGLGLMGLIGGLKSGQKVNPMMLEEGKTV